MLEYQPIPPPLLVDAIARKMMSSPIKPECPTNIGAMLKSPIRSFWFESIFENYDKMDATGTWSAPILISEILLDIKKAMMIYRPVLSFKVKSTDVTNVFELYTRTCADGSQKADNSQMFSLNFATVIDTASLRFLVAIASSYYMKGYVLDISNAFQNKWKTNPMARYYLRLPVKYLDWFKDKYPNHALLSNQGSDYILQC